MQYEFVGSWTQESHLSLEILASLRDLNHRFLDLAAPRNPGWSGAGNGAQPSALAGCLARLSPAQRAGTANCPYALFDLRFEDEEYWQLRLQNAGRWRVGDEADADNETVTFVRLALFFAWYVAACATLGAPMLLGMSSGTASAFRRATVNLLPTLVATEASNLTARWSGCNAYWIALTGAAARDDPAALRRIQLYGLQLAAAARLPKLPRPTHP